MITHRLDIVSASFDDKVALSYRGSVIKPLRLPLLEGARLLLKLGLASRGDRIEVWRGDVMCLAGLVGVAANLEPHSSGGFGRYRSRHGGVTGRVVRPATQVAGASEKRTGEPRTGFWRPSVDGPSPIFRRPSPG